MFHQRSMPILSAALAMSLAAACVDAGDPGTDEAFVFGLTADEVLAAKRVAQTELTDAAWLDAHRGDFDCRRYGDLCRMVGPDQAADVIELGYRMAIDGADRDAVRAAQDDAIARAPEVPDVADTLFDVSTRYHYDTSGNMRLKLVAHATLMWPSLELRASGYCVLQKDIAGFWASKADRISGSLLATYQGPTNFLDAGAVEDDSTLELGPIQHAGSTLTSRMACQVTEGTWIASDSITAAI